MIFKRCSCLDSSSGRQLGRICPRLAQGGHGIWYFHVSTNLMGRRERVRRGGYPNRTAARYARDEALGRSRTDQTSHGWTLARWLGTGQLTAFFTVATQAPEITLTRTNQIGDRDEGILGRLRGPEATRWCAWSSCRNQTGLT